MNAAVEQRKYSVIYYYDEGKISLHFKALSEMAILKEDFIFLALSNPDEQTLTSLQIKKMPALAGVIPPKNSDSDQVQQFTYGGEINFGEILSNLVQLIGKTDEYKEMQDMSLRQKKRKAASQVRKMEEITDQKKWEEKCLDKKGCAIAFLKGDVTVIN